MIIPRKDKPYFYPPFFDISCFWQESTGLSHKIRVYIPFETTMTFTPFLMYWPSCMWSNIRVGGVLEERLCI